MKVEVRDEKGKLIWSRSDVGGFTSPAYAFDTTLEQIKQVLGLALEQCVGELAVSDDVDRVADISAATT